MTGEQDEAVIQQAGNHLLGALDSAAWLNVFARLALAAGVFYAVAGIVFAFSEEEPGGIAFGLGGLLLGGLFWALLKGFASIIWLMTDRILVGALDEDDE